jgi:ribonuclease J
LDHSGLLPYSTSTIPIYASKGTSKVMLATSVFGGQQALDTSRFNEIAPNKRVQIGDMQITAFPVDHSVYGSLAFLIESSGKSVLYSGDLRLHGRKPGMMNALLENFRNRSLEVLIMEGTHFSFAGESGPTESELEQTILALIREAPKLVLASFSPLNLDRLVTYYRATKAAKRTLVVDAYAAFVMHLLASETRIPRPTRESGIRVLFNEAFLRRDLLKLQSLWKDNRIELQQILSEPRDFVMLFRPSMTDLDFAGSLPQESHCLYSYWQGYLEREDWKATQQRLQDVGGKLIPAHVSGHIYIKDLLEFVRAINAKTVVPIHTFEPERFREHFANVQCLQDGQCFEV